MKSSPAAKEDAPSNTPAIKSAGRPPLLGIIIVILIIAAIPSFYFYNQYQKTAKLLQNSPASNAKEVDELVTRVGQLIELPKNERPTVATVKDITKLKSLPFFRNAQNGDKTLIYTKAKKAFLYRPSTDKIIEVGPITVNVSPGPKVSPTAQPVKVVIYNGTNTVGLGGQIEQQIKSKNSNITVTDVMNAKKNTYTKTLVIDLTGVNKANAAALAAQLGGEVSTIPDGEIKPDADILVIAGK